MAARARTPSPTRLSVFAPGAVPAATRRALTARRVPATAVKRLASSTSMMQIELFFAGLVCTDGGITSGVILSEYGYADFGVNYGGQRTSVLLLLHSYWSSLLTISMQWDLSHVNLDINIPTRLVVSDGQEVFCKSDSAAGCPSSDAYSTSTDYAADRNSPLGQVS